MSAEPGPDLVLDARPEVLQSRGASRDHFSAIYQRGAPREIGAPQPEVVRLAEAGAIRGPVLDVGCGTGANARYLASRGFTVTAVDFVDAVIADAAAEAATRNLSVRFLAADVLDLGGLDRTFATVLDSGTFHSFSDDQRPRYAASIAAVTAPGSSLHVICFSDREDRPGGPRRVAPHEITETLHQHWDLRSMVETRYSVSFLDGGARALAAHLVRVR